MNEWVHTYKKTKTHRNSLRFQPRHATCAVAVDVVAVKRAEHVARSNTSQCHWKAFLNVGDNNTGHILGVFDASKRQKRRRSVMNGTAAGGRVKPDSSYNLKSS